MPYLSSPKWTAPESNRNLRLAEAALCQLELAAHRGAAPGTGLSPGVAGLSFAAPLNLAAGWRLPQMLTLWRCQLTSPYLGTQGPQESNPHSARVGAGPPNRWLIPIKGEPPGENSLGRFPVTRIQSYPGTSAMHRASVADGWLYQPRDSFACLSIMSKG